MGHNNVHAKLTYTAIFLARMGAFILGNLGSVVHIIQIQSVFEQLESNFHFSYEL